MQICKKKYRKYANFMQIFLHYIKIPKHANNIITCNTIVVKCVINTKYRY